VCWNELERGPSVDDDESLESALEAELDLSRIELLFSHEWPYAAALAWRALRSSAREVLRPGSEDTAEGRGGGTTWKEPSL
jgi:hypothetical protein